ncbi:MAG TPA: hypothetical protein IAA29_16100 [Candidatus Paenibacillus intestinavium]|nr:hypothetical protein [Candidatus Paenibacillus intestinavium]
MKRNLSVCLFVVIMTLVGCPNSIVTTPDASMFNITIDTPTNLQAGESILLTGKLVNHSDSSWELEHGADMFTYDVYDSNGEYILPAGNYTNVSKAKFRIKHDGSGNEFEIESEPLSIKVT